MSVDQILGARVQGLNALADPVRLAVVDALVAADLSPGALASALAVPGNLLAHHLNVLEDAGVVRRVRSEADRRRSYVQLVPGALQGLLPGADVQHAPRVVFVCTHNSARSPIAAAVWRTCSVVPVASGGTRPAVRVNPGAVAVARRHGVRLGRACLLVAQSGVAGSTTFGDHVTIAGQSGVAGHVRVGERTVIAAKSAVFSDVEPGSFVAGSPAVDHRAWKRSAAALKRLPELRSEIARLRERIRALESELGHASPQED